jgi:hypothetical protein
MSTTPLSPESAPKSSAVRQAAGPETRNYHQPGLPVLSFAYALYCDTEFSLASFKIWLEARIEGRDYRGYLEPYRWDQKRRFPMRAIELIAVDVEAAKKMDDKGRYLPTDSQAEEVAGFLLREITGAPEAPMAPGEVPPPPAQTPPPPQLPASKSAERPLLSCLAVIFMNQDPTFRKSPTTFLAGYALTEQAKAVLLEFAKGGATFLTGRQGQALLPDLITEFVKPPACW